jgi:Glycosyltransferases involved in cell wall biogenesis
MNNLVSVIIPVYNAEKTLSICLESLEKQTYTDIEYIFVNDCSTDNSLKLIENFAFTMQKKLLLKLFHMKLMAELQRLEIRD